MTMCRIIMSVLLLYKCVSIDVLLYIQHQMYVWCSITILHTAQERIVPCEWLKVVILRSIKEKYNPYCRE